MSPCVCETAFVSHTCYFLLNFLPKYYIQICCMPSNFYNHWILYSAYGMACRWFLSSTPGAQRPIVPLMGCSHVLWTWCKWGTRLLKLRQWWAQGPSHDGGWQYARWHCSEVAWHRDMQEWAQGNSTWGTYFTVFKHGRRMFQMSGFDSHHYRYRLRHRLITAMYWPLQNTIIQPIIGRIRRFRSLFPSKRKKII